MNKEQACIICTVEATHDAQAHNPVLCRPLSALQAVMR